MKLIFTYDNTELKEIGRITATNEDAFKEIHVLTVDENNKSRNLFDVATDIKKQAPETEPCIIFIDQFLACADEGFEWLQRNAGIALIKFLRMMEVRHHIVLVTPYTPLQLIQENSSNLLVTSKGISFAKYLYEFSDKTQLELETLASKTFDEKQDLKPYILADFRLPEDERHNWANWWGIVQLTDVHRDLFPKELVFKDQMDKDLRYPGDLDAHLKSLKSRQALFLYRYNVNFKAAISEEEERIIIKLQNRIENDIQYLKKRIEGTGKKSPMPNDWTDFIKDRERIIEENRKNLDWIRTELPFIQNQIEEAKEGLKNGRNLLFEKEKELAQSENRLQQLKGRIIETSDDFKKEISALRFNKPEFIPRILHIDDIAQQGWSEIFQLLIYGKEQSSEIFGNITVDKNQISEIYTTLRQEIDKLDPNLILLDLRLQYESGVQLRVEELSGAQILKKIKNDFPGLPVMITTASNKVWSYQTLLNFGADAYWMKEGLDVSTSLSASERGKYSVENYRDFLDKVNKLCGEKYQFYKRFSGKLHQLDPNITYWWESTSTLNNWCNIPMGAITSLNSTEKKTVFHALEIGRNLLRSYLRESEFEKQDEKHLKVILSNIILCIHSVLELIHRYKNEHSGYIEMPISQKQVAERKDYIAYFLTKYRDCSGHHGGIEKIQYDYVETYLRGIYTYLFSNEFIQIEDADGKVDLTEYKKFTDWGENSYLNSEFKKMAFTKDKETKYFNAYKIFNSF